MNQWGVAKLSAVVAATGMLGVARFSSRTPQAFAPSAAHRAFLSSNSLGMISGAASAVDEGKAFGGAGVGGSVQFLAEKAASGYKGTAARDAGAADAPSETVRKIVRTATLTFEVGDQARARAIVRAAAFRHGGVIDSDQTSGAGDDQSGVLVIKAAPEQLDAILKDLEGVGRAVQRSVSSQNMSEEYVDLKARLENYRKVEKRLTDLLAFKTRKLGDVLQVEHELERVGQEIEQTIGRMKYIDHLAAQSSVTVRLLQPHLVAAAQAPGVMTEIRNSLAKSLNTFVGTGLALLNLSGFILAVGLWTAPVTALVWLLKRRIWG